MKQLLPHIASGINENGHATLVTDYYELFDYIEDFLIEVLETPYECITRHERKGDEIIEIQFPIKTSIKDVEESLLKLSAEENQRIYSLNNRRKL